MLKSEILDFLGHKISESFIISYLIGKVDVNEPLKYESVITSSFYKPIVKINILFTWIVQHTFIQALSHRIDLKSIVIFLFIVSLVIFPGYGTENTGAALLPGSPVGSISNRSGFIFNLLIFFLTLTSIGIIFLVDIAKNMNVLKLSKFEIILLLFILSLTVSSLFSVYPAITFTWYIKVFRGIAMYFIFSRLIIKKNQIFAISLAFLSIIYIESILAILQYFQGGFVGLPIETAQNVSNNQILYTSINNVQYFRPSGTFITGNGITFLLSFSIPFTLILLFYKGQIIKIMSIATVFISGLISIITLSRWGMITFLFSGALYFFVLYSLKRKRTQVKTTSKIFVLIILILLFVLISRNEFVTRFFYINLADTSLVTRLQLITQAIYNIKNNLFFGIGGGTFPKYLINYDFTPLQISKTFPNAVHNLPLLTVAETGIIGGILFFVVIIYFFVPLFKQLFSNKYKGDFLTLYAFAVFISSLTFFFNGMWEIRSLNEHLTIILWINLGIYINLSKNIGKNVSVN